MSSRSLVSGARISARSATVTRRLSSSLPSCSKSWCGASRSLRNLPTMLCEQSNTSPTAIGWSWRAKVAMFTGFALSKTRKLRS